MDINTAEETLFKIRAASKDIILLMNIQQEDVKYCQDMLHSTRLPFYFRAMVRSIFAGMEGVISSIKNYAYSCRHQAGVEFSEGELLTLRERAYRLNDNGIVQDQSMNIKLRDNIKFTFYAYAKANMTVYKLDASGVGWRNLRESIAIRDRITHPKGSIDMIVTVPEIDTVTRAYNWFNGCVKEVMKLSDEGLLKDIEKRISPEEYQELLKALESFDSQNPR